MGRNLHQLKHFYHAARIITKMEVLKMQDYGPLPLTWQRIDRFPADFLLRHHQIRDCSGASQVNNFKF